MKEKREEEREGASGKDLKCNKGGHENSRKNNTKEETE